MIGSDYWSGDGGGFVGGRGGWVFCWVGFSVGTGVAVGSGKGALVGESVSVGESVMLNGVTLGASQAVGVPVGVLVSSGAGVSFRTVVGLVVGVVSIISSSLNT